MDPTSNDQSLGIGLFAVHLGMISQEQLALAVKALQQAGAPSLDLILLEQKLITSDQHRQLLELFRQQWSRFAAGAEENDESLAIDTKLIEQMDWGASPSYWQWLLQASDEASGEVDPFATNLKLSSSNTNDKGKLAGSNPGSSPSPSDPSASKESRASKRSSVQDTGSLSPVMSGAGSKPIDRFEILRFHAKGGLGEVYVALDKQLGREVALKIIQSDKVHHGDLRSRFVIEAELTGGLEHPGIVPVYASGQLEDGRPFYAMRFIQGESLREASDRFHRMMIEPQRGTASKRNQYRSEEFRRLLRSFVAACMAIEYAHSRGVIHRDIKPSNLMVGRFGETLVVDWGLAKSTGRDTVLRPVEEPTLRAASEGLSSATMIGSVVGTPGFMGPEQVLQNGGETGTHSDIYALGATLFSLLQGSSPLGDISYQQYRKLIEQSKFPERATLSPHVPSPLAAICNKAMSLEPTERYRTARELADEIERWLVDDVVQAYPEPLLELSRRWVRRHMALAASIAVALIVSTIGLGVGYVAVMKERDQTILARDGEKARKAEALEQRDRAINAEGLAKQRLVELEKESQRTKKTIAFFEEHILASVRPEGVGGGLGRDVTVMKAIESAEQAIERSFVDEPLIVASLQNTLANSYFYLGNHEKSRQLLELSLATFEKHAPEQSPERLQATNDLAIVWNSFGEQQKSIPMLEKAIAVCDKMGDRDSDLRLNLNDTLGMSYIEDDADKGIRILEQNLADRKRRLTNRPAPASDPLLTHSINNLATARFKKNPNDPEILKLYKEAMEVSKRDRSESDREVLVFTTNYAQALHQAGDTKQAEELLRRVLAFQQEKLGEKHVQTCVTWFNIGNIHLSRGEAKEAIEAYQTAYDGVVSEFGAGHRSTHIFLFNLFAAFEADGNPSEAISMVETLLPEVERLYGAGSAEMVLFHAVLGKLCITAGQYDRAAAIFSNTLVERAGEQLTESRDKRIALYNLVHAYFGSKQYQKAYDAIGLYMSAMKENPTADTELYPRFVSSYNRICIELGKAGEAEALVKKQLDDLLAAGASQFAAADWMADYGVNLVRQRRIAEGKEWLSKVDRILTAPERELDKTWAIGRVQWIDDFLAVGEVSEGLAWAQSAIEEVEKRKPDESVLWILQFQRLKCQLRLLLPESTTEGDGSPQSNLTPEQRAELDATAEQLKQLSQQLDTLPPLGALPWVSPKEEVDKELKRIRK